MNDIDNIIDNYFEGRSSLEEEKILKEYFRGNKVQPGHEIYRPLFAVFPEEKRVTAPLTDISYPQKKKKTIPLRRIGIISAIAVAAALLFIILHPATTSPVYPEYVVIVNGNPVTDPQEARQYAEHMFSEAENIVRKTYQPFHQAADMRNDLNAERILRETEQKIQYIKTGNTP